MKLRWLVMVILVTVADTPAGSGTTPGQIAFIDLDSAENPEPVAWFGTRRVSVQKMGRRWFAIIGVPISSLPGRYLVTYSLSGEPNQSKAFMVSPGKFALADRSPERSGEIQSPAYWRSRNFKTIISQWHPISPGPPEFRLPVDGEIVNDFGEMTESSPQNFSHFPWLSIRVDSGAPVNSPGGGKIIDAGPMNACGEGVLISHGHSLYSLVCGMQSLSVAAGENVSVGDLIGFGPAAGDTADSQIFWMFLANANFVDPASIADHGA